MARLTKFWMAGALLCVTSLISLAQAGPVNRIAREIDNSQMTRLSGNVNPRIRAAADLGRANGAARLNGVSMFFAPSASQKAALQALLAEQHDPNSPNYHQWITPEEYADRFGMSTQDIAKVTAWLQGQGLKVDGVNRTRDRIFFSGATSRVESAFQTEFHRYMVNGENHFANARELSVPSALAGTVLGFRNLDDFRLKPRVRTLSPRFTSSISGNTYLAPADVATIYNLNPLYAAGFDGTGQTIAVAGQTLISLSDVNNFRAAAGLPVNPPQLVLLPGSGTAQTFTSDEVESDLDVQWSGALAPNAKIIFVFSGNSPTKDVRDAMFYAIDNQLAPVVSMSYGLCELDANLSGDLAQFQAEAQKANGFGMTIMAASGDAGATDCESSTATIAIRGISVDVPATVAEVTGVGGTSFAGDSGSGQATYWIQATPPNDVVTSAKSYIPETTWNDAFASATGGGVSTVVLKPAFQTALTPADGHRDVPDVALSASPNHDGYLICDLDNSDATHGGACNSGFRDTATSLLFPAGGTSFGAPEFAGIISLINQATQNAGGSGNVNPTLYTLAGSSATYAAAFHDITTGDNKQLCLGGSTGCTSANSHVAIAATGRHFPTYAALFLVALGAVFLSLGRRRGVAVAGMLVVIAAFSLQIACGGGSSNSGGGGGGGGNPPPNVLIGWSAGTGYDLVTGLGSVNGSALATNWPGYTTSPAFSVQGNAITMTTTAAGTTNIALARTSSSFSGSVALSCVASGDVTGDPLPTCGLGTSPITLNSGTPTGNSTLTVNAAHVGTYLVTVTGKSGSISHAVTIPVTVN